MRPIEFVYSINGTAPERVDEMVEANRYISAATCGPLNAFIRLMGHAALEKVDEISEYEVIMDGKMSFLQLSPNHREY
jgi:hypothetical protein